MTIPLEMLLSIKVLTTDDGTSSKVNTLPQACDDGASWKPNTVYTVRLCSSTVNILSVVFPVSVLSTQRTLRVAASFRFLPASLLCLFPSWKSSACHLTASCSPVPVDHSVRAHGASHTATPSCPATPHWTRHPHQRHSATCEMPLRSLKTVICLWALFWVLHLGPIPSSYLNIKHSSCWDYECLCKMFFAIPKAQFMLLCQSCTP